MTMHEPSGAESDVGRWLALLRDGSEEEQQLARTELGLILEARGLLDDATEAYARNVEDGVSDRRPYERLAALARARGDHATEARALRGLANLLAPALVAPAAVLPDAAPEPTVPEMGTQDAFEAPAPDAAVESAVLAAPAAEVQSSEASVDEQPATPQVEATLAPAPANAPRDRTARHANRPQTHPREDDDPGTALHHVLEMHPEETRHHAEPTPDGTGGSGIARTLLTLAMLVPLLAVIVGAALWWPSGPAASQTAAPSGGPGGIAPIASSTSVELRLIAGTPSPIPSPIFSPTGTLLPSPSLTPTIASTPLAARCTDAGLHFPETSDAEGAVRAAYREYMARQGVTIDPTSTLFDGLGEAYASRHDEVVAGWVAVTLQRERRELTPFPLADYVASDVIVATGPGTYQLRATVSPQGWSEMRAWPAETCEGAFMRSPANARWVDLMQASVGDITWALPTRTPTR